MNRMRSPEDPNIRFEITEDRPEDNPQILAIKLAEALTASANHQRDATTFKTSAQSERTKAQQMQSIISQLKKRQKNPVPNVSRMDPLNEYNLEACEAEFKLLRERAQELQKESDEHNKLAQEARLESERLQKKIHRINNELRQQQQK